MPDGQEPSISLLVLGGRGRLGGRVVELLDGRGEAVDVLGRDTPTDRVRGGDVVCNLATATSTVVGEWAAAGARAGGYVDAAPTASSHVLLRDQPPVGPGPVMPGVGWLSAVGDAVAVMAAGRLPMPRRVDVTAWVPSRRGLVAGAGWRERDQLWRAVTEPVPALVDGRVVNDRIAQARRLAWFPRPVGPHHAVAVPGTHWRTLPRVLPGVETVRTALALRSSSAELLQALGELARHRTHADGWPLLVPRRATDGTTDSQRWAIVAEVADADGSLVRGWAYGTDRHEVTAQVLALVAARLLGSAGHAPGSGPIGVTELVAPDTLLDDLAARTGLRWSVSDRTPAS